MEDAVDASALKLYLKPYGFFAESEQAWSNTSSSADRPELRLCLGGHSEKDNHTYYTIKCELCASRPSLRLTWEDQKRLAALREDLHDTVKNELGKDYPDVFAAAPFAKRGGWGGTSDRLKKWLETLADAVNKGTAPPVLVFQVLLFFGAPAQSDHQISAECVPEGSSTPTIAPINEPPPVAPDVLAEPLPPVIVGSIMKPGDDKQSGVEVVTAAPSPISVCDIAERVDGGGGECSAREEDDNSEMEKPKRTGSFLLRGKSQPNVTSEARSKSEERSPDVSLRKSATGDTLGGLGIMQRRSTSLGAKPKPKDATLGYLEDYGYAAASKTQWSAGADASCAKPVLRLKLDGHSEESGHTLYTIKCHLFSEKREDIHYDWTCKRRLGKLREDLHDRVKDDLGRNYEEFFSQAPFARRGGLSGTTGRLQTWLETLASCINDQNVSPSLVASVLQFFGTPTPPKAMCSTPRQSLVPQVWGEPLPEEMRVVRAQSASPEPPPIPVARSESPPQLRQSKSRSLSPRKSIGRAASPDNEQDIGKQQSDQSKEPAHSDDEQEPSQFDGKKRQKGYRKLRDWFIRLRQSLSRSTLPCASSS